MDRAASAFWGDYIYISAVPGAVNAVWTDSRDLEPGADARAGANPRASRCSRATAHTCRTTSTRLRTPRRRSTIPAWMREASTRTSTARASDRVGGAPADPRARPWRLPLGTAVEVSRAARSHRPAGPQGLGSMGRDMSAPIDASRVEEVARFLARFAPFRDLDAARLRDVAEHAGSRSFSPGTEILHRSSEPADHPVRDPSGRGRRPR